jgi:hypothetical protein
MEGFQYVAFRADAEGGDLFATAIDIRRRLFRERYGAASQIDADEFDSEAIHMLVYRGSEVVCSCRFTSQEAGPGLELARLIDISPLLAPGRVFGEVSKLAITKEHRRISARSFLLLGYAKTSFAVAERRGFTDYLIWVPKELEPVYGAVGFAPVQGLRFAHPRLGNLVHQVMRLDLKELSARANATGWVSRVFRDPLPPNITLLL